jgi:hypothetical protein
MINLPANCKTEAQRLSYAFKLLDIIIKKHNSDGNGTTTDMLYKIKEVHKLRNENIELAKSSNYHNMRSSDIVNGLVNLPPSVNTGNEGARLSALYALSGEVDLSENEDFMLQMRQAKQDAVDGTYWNPKIEDIV